MVEDAAIERALLASEEHALEPLQDGTNRLR
jgi:hypothetical protein